MRGIASAAADCLDKGYRPIRDYAVIGDCHGAALVARDGGIDWCCLERFDADPVLARLLDARQGGFLEIEPEDTTGVVRNYLPGTNILRTVFTTAKGRIEVIDFTPVWGSEDDYNGAGPHAPKMLVRLIEGVAGRVHVKARFRPLGPGWDTSPAAFHLSAGRAIAQDRAALYGNFSFIITGDTVQGLAEVSPGQRRYLVLARRPLDDPPSIADAQRMLARTQLFWEEWMSQCCYDGPYSESVHRSLLVLKLLTYAPTGAIVAAPTTSLPEVLGGNRNWDYRYCWLRDGALVLHALTAMGYSDEARHFLDFHRLCCMKKLPAVQVVYGISGETELPERTIDHLEGYCGSRPVRVGNAAYPQTQLDIYGEVLDWAYTYRLLGGSFAPDLEGMLRQLADFVAAHWHEPDQGMWEFRGPPRHHVHSKIMSWVALDRALRMFGDNGRWGWASAAIIEAIWGRGVDPEGGHLLQAFDRPGTDAALLLLPQLGFPIEGDTFDRTVRAIESELRSGNYVRRYSVPDGLEGQEGAFLICSFWLVDALLFLDRRSEAQALFERLLCKANDVGLYSEEIDPDSDAFLGNFPQAFTHLALVNSALGLRLHETGGRAALLGTHGDRARRCVIGSPAGREERFPAVRPRHV